MPPNSGDLVPESVQLGEKIEELSQKTREVLRVMEEARETDTARFAKAKEEQEALAEQIQTLMDERATKQRQEEFESAKAQMEELLAANRTKSKANLIGSGKTDTYAEDAPFFPTLAFSRHPDPRISKAAWEDLESMGSSYTDRPVWSSGLAGVWGPNGKATLGDTASAGGNVVPNNVVEAFITAARAPGLRDLLTTITGVTGAGVDLPYETSAPARATVIAAGATKTNLDFTTPAYSVTLATLAAIYDVGNQLLRHSAGAAEQLVRERLATALRDGESYYVISGSGSSEPEGINTALTGTPYITTRSGTVDTVAGSIVGAVADAAGQLGNRNRDSNLACLMNPADFWAAASEGDSNSGFFFEPGASPAARAWGIRIVPNSNLSSDTAILGDFKAARLYIGQGYRVDVSTEAGDRWDVNLTGFRAELEIAFDARPAVHTGAFQRIADVRG